MSHFGQQVQDDREVFDEFCSSPGGPGTDWHSVDHGDDRTTPDIICTSDGGDTTFFALTQVDPEELHNLVALSESDRRSPSSSPHWLTGAEWSLFCTKYHGSVLDLGKPKDCAHPDGAVQRVFRYLLKRDPRIDFPQGPDGETLVLYDDITPGGDLDVSLHRLHQGSDYLSICHLPGVCLNPMPLVEDPEIWHGAVTSRNPAVAAIAEESGKPYCDQSGHPLHAQALHLVVWTGMDSGGFLEETSQYLESVIGRTTWELAFASVWLFDRVRQRIACHVLGPSSSD